jgi:hypothetical protein
MKIKVAIANFGTKQLEHTHRVIQEFNSFKKHSVDLMVYTTVPVDYAHRLYPESIGTHLPFMCREDMAAAANDYDLFIYNENDMLITENNIDAFVEHSSKLKDGTVSGYIRYEILSGAKILLDPNPHWGAIISKKTETSFEMHNKHQGCWVLLQKDFKTAINSGKFLCKPHNGPYGFLEQGASDPYTQCNLSKVFPLDYDLCERLLIHHLPNKYVKHNEWLRHGITLKTLFESHI